MANILDYLAWRGDLSLLQSPYNDVDSLILSRVSYLPFDGIVPDTFGGPSITLAGAYGRYQELRASGIPGACTPVLLEDDLALFRALAQSRRFGGLLLSGFINTIDPAAGEQFAAVTISAGNSGPIYVSFRGTDTTLVGWKEDFSMAFLPSIPSQKSAVEYLEQAASAVPGDIYTGGHSKGGNLAVYVLPSASRISNPESGLSPITTALGFIRPYYPVKGTKQSRAASKPFSPNPLSLGCFWIMRRIIPLSTAPSPACSSMICIPGKSLEPVLSSWIQLPTAASL